MTLQMTPETVSKISAHHRERGAIVYVRQSTTNNRQF